MSPIYRLRSHAGLTQRQLAERCDTSQAAIAAYETDAKSPTLRTVTRIASCLNLEVTIDVVPSMTREDHRSLAYHRAVADQVRQDPDRVVHSARLVLARQSALHPHAAPLFERWAAWLALAPEDLITLMLSPSLDAREMRQVSPFAGLLSARQRAQILRAFSRNHVA